MILPSNGSRRPRCAWKPAPKPLAEGLFEVSLTVTITAKLGDRTAYLVEVQQGGLFALRGFDDGQMGHMLHAYCPNLLFPFARGTGLVDRQGWVSSAAAQSDQLR